MPLLEDQEIDGQALLLLSQDTMVKCLGIKLGPALKVRKDCIEELICFDLLCLSLSLSQIMAHVEQLKQQQATHT